ncbi:Fic family protein [Microbacterium sp.]|uniref:Fic family protein n=1 Tax=Microbacterium sp. TaxID=51671 RepID=UPI0039E6E2B0
MPLRQPAPDLDDLRRGLLQDADRLDRVLFSPPLDDSHYYHWSQLLRRDPPEGLTHEEWWFRLKLQRSSQSRTVALRAKHGSAFTFSMTDELLQLTEEIGRRAGGSVAGEGGALTPHGRDRFIVRSLVEEAITSSQLEGASTSRRVAVELLSTGRDPRTKSERMILNNYRAMRLVTESSSDPLTPAWILELHSVLTEGTLDDPSDAGRLETPDHERVSVWAGEIHVHVPPPAEELPARLHELSAFANGSAADSPFIPPIVRAIITHFMFGYDHYFADGNGRIARTAFYWSMLHNGYWLAEYLTISKILRAAPGKYGDSYQYTEDDDGDLTYFILHQLRVIKRSLDELDRYIETKQRESRRVQFALRSAARDFNLRQIQILEWLTRENPAGVTSMEIANRFRVSTQTARNDLSYLESFDLLTRGAAKHPISWIPVSDLPSRLAALGDES